MKPLVPFLFVLCGAWSAFGQSVAGTGAVAGFILETPDSGLDSGLPDAAVTVANSALGLRRQTDTTDDGTFDIPALPPAAGYRLSVVCKGYNDWNSEPFEIAVGQPKIFRIRMQKEGSAGATSTDNLKTISLDQSGFTTWVDPIRTAQLPTSGRQLDALVLLSPAGSREMGGRITFQGVTANSILNDSIAIHSGYFGERTSIAHALTQDNIQELRTLSAGYPAEFGRALGGIVDAISPNWIERFARRRLWLFGE